MRPRNDAKMGRSHDPDAAKTDLDIGKGFGLIPEDGSIVGLAIMIVIFGKDDSVMEVRIKSIDSMDGPKEALRCHGID